MGVTQGLHDHSDGAEKVFWEKSGIRRGLGVVMLLCRVLGVLLLVTWAAAAAHGGRRDGRPLWESVGVMLCLLQSSCSAVIPGVAGGNWVKREQLDGSEFLPSSKRPSLDQCRLSGPAPS